MIKNKKTVIILITAFLIILGAILVVIFLKLNNRNVVSSKAGDITRYEWIEMLCEQAGMTEYADSDPYFKDVDEHDKYFSYIQSAVEWGVLDTSSDFEGDSLVSGRDIALTVMKTIGQKKIQIYLESEEEITEDIYVELAIENGIVEKRQLKKGFSEEECEQVLEVFAELYFGEFWKEDYSKVTYQDDIVELASGDVLRSNADNSEIVVAESVLNSLEAGTIIVFEEGKTQLKIAREVTSVDVDGTLSLETVELDEVVESLVVSDITELTFEDIVNYYEIEENGNAVSSLNYQPSDADRISTTGFSFGESSKGFKLSVSTEEENEVKHLEIQVTDNDTGVSYTLPISQQVESDGEYCAEVDIDKIFIGGQVVYSGIKNGLEYADVAVDAHATLTGTVKASEEKKILLCKTPVPLGSGMVGVDIQIYLVLSVEGGISFEAEVPVQASVYYEKDKGLRNFKQDISVENPTIEANCKAGVMLRFEPTLVILGCLNVMDAEFDIGATASASVITRPNSQICADISVAFPVVTLSICGDDDADTIMGAMGISAEWEIISSHDARFRFGLHYELLADMTAQFVEECTYQEQEQRQGQEQQQEQEQEQEQEDVGNSNTYITKYGDTKFAFDYPDNWVVTYAESNEIFNEYVELENERGVIIYYWEFNVFPLGGHGHTVMTNAEIVKEADASIENFMIGKIIEVAYIDWETGEEYSVEDGVIKYAVMPQDYVGTHNNMPGPSATYYEEFSFLYNSSRYMMLAEPISAEGGFTEEEEKEVLAILSSFRLASEDDLVAAENAISEND